MDASADRLKINLNQNVWGLVVALAALGVGEYFKLSVLFIFGVVIALIMVISVAFTTYAYTVNYWRNKFDR